MAFLAAIGPTLSTIGTVVSTVGAVQTARANASIESENIRSAQFEKEDRLKEQKRLNRQRVGSARAGFAASGVAVDEGSPLLVLEETIRLGEEDLQAIERGSDAKIRNAVIRRGAARTKSTTSLLSGIFSAGSTLLTKKKAA